MVTTLFPNDFVQAVGVIDSRLKTVAIWQKPEEETTKEEYKRGIVYYLKDDVVVGVVLLGVYGKVNIILVRQLFKRFSFKQRLKKITGFYVKLVCFITFIITILTRILG